MSPIKNKANVAQALQTKKRVSLIERVGRTLLSLVTAFLCCYFLWAWQEMRTRDLPPQGQADLEDDPFGSLQDVINGNWHFAGSPWSVKVAEVNDAWLQSGLEAEVKLQPHPLNQAGDSHQTIIAMVEMSGAVASTEGPVAIYRLHSNDVRGSAFAPSEAPRNIQLVRLAQRRSEGTWSFIEIRQQEDVGNTTAVSLLPAHPSNKQLAFRLDANDKVCAELVSLGSDLAGLQSLWRQAGWSIQDQSVDESVAIHDSVTSGLIQSERPLVCTKGAEAVVAIVSQHSGQSTLLLIRSP